MIEVMAAWCFIVAGTPPVCMTFHSLAPSQVACKKMIYTATHRAQLHGAEIVSASCKEKGDKATEPRPFPPDFLP